MRAHVALLITVRPAVSCAPRRPASGPVPTAEPPGPQVETGDSARPRGGGAPGARRPRPYDRVITREARTVRGLFNVQMVGDRLYFEIPRRELGRDQLAIGRYTRAPAPTTTTGGFGTYGGDRFVT